MRFDDSLRTVLASDMTPGAGARAAWRQLVDLIGRGRVPADPAILDRLRQLRGSVPEPVRAATARVLAASSPAVALVALFAEDAHAVAAPLLREVQLADAAWEQLLPRLNPALRSVLRTRRDLPGGAVRGLEGFGSTDFALGAPEPEAPVAAVPAPPAPPARPDAPLGPTPFQPLGAIARGLPLVAEALARREPLAADPAFPIPDLVARIERFQRARAAPTADPMPAPAAPIVRAPSTAFTFATDDRGVVVAVDGIPAEPVVGLSLAHAGRQSAGQVDAFVAGAFRRRSRFTDARLEIGGTSTAAGSWRLSAAPDFDHRTGRFVGYQGEGRRPRSDQSASPAARARADTLRQLVHELRTPASAITGFAELIESELMGPVPPHHRRVAADIRNRAVDLLEAIEDLDIAARMEGNALDLRPGHVDLAALAGRTLDGLAPLLALRGGRATLVAAEAVRFVSGDEAALERLLSRLLAAAAAATGPGEEIMVRVTGEVTATRLTVSRPRAWTPLDEGMLLSLEADEAAGEGSLLGTGFCLRLIRNLALELGGSLSIDADALTLHLRSDHRQAAGQAASP